LYLIEPKRVTKRVTVMSELLERIDLRFDFVEEKLKQYKIDEETGCWNWQGKIKRTRGNYGQLTIYVRNRRPQKRTFAAHRISFAFFENQDPGAMSVMHSCDNPTCINPEHLSLGTHSENMRDMVEKGRSTKGEKNPRSLLSESAVIDIVAKIKLGKGNTEIARELPVSHAQVSNIRSGKSWGEFTANLGYVPSDYVCFKRSA
jgi:hypothetical protein